MVQDDNELRLTQRNGRTLTPFDFYAGGLQRMCAKCEGSWLDWVKKH